MLTPESPARGIEQLFLGGIVAHLGSRGTLVKWMRGMSTRSRRGFNESQPDSWLKIRPQLYNTAGIYIYIHSSNETFNRRHRLLDYFVLSPGRA